MGIRRLMEVSIAAAFFAILAHRMIGADTHLGYILIPFAIIGVNWGLSNSGIISGVNHSVAPARVGERSVPLPLFGT